MEFLVKRENPRLISIISPRADALLAVSAGICGVSTKSIPKFFYQVLQMNKSLVLIAVIAAAALVACGKKEEAPAPAPVEAPAAAAAVVDAAASAAEAATVAADAVAASASAAGEAADKAVDAAAEAAKAAASK